ncbi:MAG: class I SAM-dependent methyltransferase [Planctomycetota bacterium]|nr:class I SAM-dependent methyltransferase [Planctomycetota bacterium]
MPWFRFVARFFMIWFQVGNFAIGQEPAKPAANARYEFNQRHDPNGIGKFYLGREIAYVMTHEGAGWLDRTEREKEENPKKLLEMLKIKPDAVVVDFGAGSGYYTLRMASMVPKGKAVAVDIQPEMLAIIERKMKADGIGNIELVRNTEDDSKLPPASADLIILVDVYHELSLPYEVTRSLAKALKPGGRLVLVEFRLEDPEVPIKLVHKMIEKQVRREMKEIPELEFVETLKDLPWQHVIIHRRKAG